MIAEWVLEFSGKDSFTKKHIAWSGTICAMKKGTRGSFILFRNNRSELKFKKFFKCQHFTKSDEGRSQFSTHPAV